MYKYLLVFSITIVFSCSKENTQDIDPDAPKISGYYERDYMGINMGFEGNPNVKLGQGDDYFISTFPNPSTDGLFTIHMKAPENTVKEITIVKAVFNPTFEENKDSVTIEGNPVFQHTTNESGIMNMKFTVVKATDSITTTNDVRKVLGYYRIYVKIDDVLLWDNIRVSE